MLQVSLSRATNVLLSVLVCHLLFQSCTKTTDEVIEPQPSPVTDKSIINISSIINARDSFNITVDGSWAIVTNPADASWLELSSSAGSGNTRIYVTTIEQNVSANKRTATLTITPGNSTLEPATVTITQEAYTFSPWTKLMGGTAWDFFSSVVPAHDGGYIAVGSTYSTDGDVAANKGLSDIWVVKMDVAGNIVWEKNFGSARYDDGKKVIQAPNGYLILGSMEGTVEGNSVAVPYLLRIDENGGIVWEKTIELGQFGSLTGISAIQSGGFICSGWNNEDAVLVKLDDAGNIGWMKTYGGLNLDRAFNVVESPDGGYVAVGNTNYLRTDSIGHYHSLDVWVFKVDQEGNWLWEKMHGGSDADFGYLIVNTQDGGALLSSLSESSDVPGFRGSGDIMLTKIDVSGNLQWQRSYGTSTSDFPRAISQLNDGNYLFIGSAAVIDGDVTENFGSKDAWVVKVSSEGVIQSQKSYGGTEPDVFEAVYAGSDQLLLVGSTSSSNGEFSVNHGTIDAWVKAIEIP